MLSLLFAGLVAAQNAPFYSFSGVFPASPTAIPVDYTTTQCVPRSTALPYYVFTHTFNSAGVRGLFFFNIAWVGLYQTTAYNISNLCGAISLTRSANKNPANFIDRYGHYFEAGTYTFVVLGDAGGFGGEFWDGAFNGRTTATSGWWVPMSGDTSADCTQSQSSEFHLYDTQSVTVSTSGFYNAYVQFSRSPGLPYPFREPYGDYSGVSVLQGAQDPATLGNMSCANVSFVTSALGGNMNSQIFNMWLNAGQTYTFVVDGGYIEDSRTANPAGSYYGNYSIIVTPTRWYNFTNSTKFLRPDQNFCSPTTTCKVEGSVPQAYAVAAFTVPPNSQFWLFADQSVLANNDYEFYIYSEYNTGVPPSMCGTTNATCWKAMDTIDGVIFDAGNATAFTLVAVGYQNNRYGNDAVLTLYTLNTILANATAGPGGGPSVAPSVAPTHNPTNLNGANLHNPGLALLSLSFIGAFVL